MTKTMLDGEVITLRNAERLVRKRYPRAVVSTHRANDGRRYSLVHAKREAGAMWIGEGKTKAAAWKYAAERIAATPVAPTRVSAGPMGGPGAGPVRS